MKKVLDFWGDLQIDFKLATLFLFCTDSRIFFSFPSHPGTTETAKGRSGSLLACCPVWQGFCFM